MTDDAPTGIEEYLDYCFDKYFKGLIEQFGMSEPGKVVSGLGALYESFARNLTIRLVNDRGQTAFDVASVHQPGDFRDVELIAELFSEDAELLSEDDELSGEDAGMFREARLKRRGVVRLTLAQQVEFLRSNWEELNRLFGAELLSETHVRLNRLGIRRSRELFG